MIRMGADEEVTTLAGVPGTPEEGLQKIDVRDIRERWGRAVSQELGMRPGLAWLPVSALRIDPSYQREVLRTGLSNIFKIARRFDWSLFGVVIVASVGEQLFAIVDGQHRVIAARLRGVEEVPCVVIDASPGKQAEAFAAINGAVTKISPLQVYHAQLAAGEPEVLALRDVVSAAHVSVCRYPVPTHKMGLGDTLAIGTLKRCHLLYGPEVLTLVLKCIVVRGIDSIGCVGEPQVKAMCHVLDAEPLFRRSEAALLASMRGFDFTRELDTVRTALGSKRRAVHVMLAKRLFEFLDDEVGS